MLMKVSEPSWAASKTTVVALWNVSASGSSLRTSETSYERLESRTARARASVSVRLSWRGALSRVVTVTSRSVLELDAVPTRVRSFAKASMHESLTAPQDAPGHAPHGESRRDPHALGHRG